MAHSRRELRSEEWAEYLNAFSGRCSGSPTRVAIEAPADGRGRDQLPGRRLLHAIDYDELRDMLEVSVGNGDPGRAALRFFIASPRTITVAEDDREHALLIDDSSGLRTVVSCAAQAAALAPAVARRPR